MMRVVLNGSQAGNRSGTGQYTGQLARWLPSLAQDVDVQVTWPSNAPRPACDREAIQAFHERDIGGPVSRVFYDQFRFGRDARGLGGDLVHCPANVGTLRGGIPMVLTVHDLSFLVEPAWFRAERAAYYRAAVTRSVRRAARVIAVSEATARDLCERLGRGRETIDVVPNGVEERFRPESDARQAEVRAAYSLPDRFWLFYGTHEPRKNLPRLIQAWSAVAEDFPISLVLAGRAGWKVGPIVKAVEQSPHAGRVHFPGFLRMEDLPAVISAAEAFVYPSLYEGFGIPVAEAMACGTPVLTSNVASLPEVAGDAAITVDPRDTEAMADGLRRLAQDDALRASLAKQGRARAAGYDWKHTAQLTLATYRKAVTQ
jgi:glycosyltransferase involved in cell wall biosynthesis